MRKFISLTDVAHAHASGTTARKLQHLFATICIFGWVFFLIRDEYFGPRSFEQYDFATDMFTCIMVVVLLLYLLSLLWQAGQNVKRQKAIAVLTVLSGGEIVTRDTQILPQARELFGKFLEEKAEGINDLLDSNPSEWKDEHTRFVQLFEAARKVGLVGHKSIPAFFGLHTPSVNTRI